MSTVPIKATVPSTADQDAVTAAIGSLKKTLPFLINLSPSDRKLTPRVGAKVKDFIIQALDVAIQNPKVLPAAFDVNGMRDDMQVHAYLTSIRLPLRQLLQEIDDTAMQFGSQAYAAARTVYASASSHFAGPPLQVAANQLGKHFGRKPKNVKSAKGNANGNGVAASTATTTAAPAATTAASSTTAPSSSTPPATHASPPAPAPITPKA